MNEGLEKLRQEGINWVEANRSKRFSGVMKLFTEFYPDKTHFIYELLQNAEDARDKSKPGSCGASVVQFTLNKESLEFEHNGEGLFTIQDVESITGIGDSSKLDDPTSIGKFGIGFKAVFAYTDTPEIRSGEYHFRIRDLVVPEGIDQHQVREQKTLFRFPFDNPKKKTADKAVSEISIGLRKLGDNTLLFLRCIRKIEYRLPDGTRGTQERIEHEGGHIEIRSSTPGNSEATSHWLRFEKIVKVQDDDGMAKDCRIAIAYRLEADDESKKEKTGWKIVPLDHGQVSIFFPAGNETSNLRFHLHAPFASTVARNSVRDCGANSQLRDHLTALVVESLGLLRKQGMLDVRFLAVLPLSGDKLPKFYEPIRLKIVKAFQNRPLTPTKSGVHAPASLLYRGPAAIQDVIGDEDLTLLTDNKAPLWAKNPPQENQREANFLADLSIEEWGWSELVRKLEECCWDEDERVSVETWIESKDDAWLCRFNALLGQAQDEHSETINVADLRLVRVATSDGDVLVKAGDAYFPPSDDVTAGPNDVYFVKPATYASGRSESRKRYARSFLESAGVRPFDEKAVIERTLALYQNGQSVSVKEHVKHIRTYIQYWKQHPEDASRFGDVPLFGILQDGVVGTRLCPTCQCLDLPYEDTGLSTLHNIHHQCPIPDGYHSALRSNELKDFVAFLKNVGVMYELTVKKVSIAERSKVSHAERLKVTALQQDYRQHGVKWTDSATDEDYTIENLVHYLCPQSASASRLVWNALIKADKAAATARFRPNQRYETRSDESLLVVHLKGHAWIPDKRGAFRTPQDLTREDLRDDFLYDDRNGLLTAIGFGESARERSEEYQQKNELAKSSGFDDAEHRDLVLQAVKGKSKDELRRMAKEHESLTREEFPEKLSADSERRRQNLVERRENAPAREKVQRERSIEPGLAGMKAEAKAYLRGAYTNRNGKLICQCCRDPMPFKLPATDQDYFEAVLFAKGLKQQFYENYLALCPTCSAKYQHACQTDEDEIKRNFLKMQPDGIAPVEIPVELAGTMVSIRFVVDHANDLRAVLGIGRS